MDSLSKEDVHKLASILISEDSVGADLMDYKYLRVYIQQDLPPEHFPKEPRSVPTEEIIAFELEGTAYLAFPHQEAIVARCPSVPDGVQKIEIDRDKLVENPAVDRQISHSMIMPQVDFTPDTKKWLEDNEVGEDYLPFRVVWETYKHERIVRHYEVEVPDGFKSWTEDEKRQWCHDKAHDLFGTHKTLPETEEERGVDQIRIEHIEEAAFVNENGNRHEIQSIENE
jgi:hypothetical protein